MTTRAPSAPSRLAVAKPMPLAAPVMMHTLCSNLIVVPLYSFALAGCLRWLSFRPRPVMFARHHDRHFQTDALRRQHLAPICDQRLVSFADGTNLPVQI